MNQEDRTQIVRAASATLLNLAQDIKHTLKDDSLAREVKRLAAKVLSDEEEKAQDKKGRPGVTEQNIDTRVRDDSQKKDPQYKMLYTTLEERLKNKQLDEDLNVVEDRLKDKRTKKLGEDIRGYYA